MTLLVLDDGHLRLEPGVLGGPVHVLDFSAGDSSQLLERVRAACDGRIIIRDGIICSSLQAECRRWFVSRLAAFPAAGTWRKTVAAGGEGGSEWWFNELSARRSDLFPTFKRLCQVAMVADTLAAEPQIRRMVLASADRRFAVAIRSLAKSRGLVFVGMGAGGLRPRAFDLARDWFRVARSAWRLASAPFRAARDFTIGPCPRVSAGSVIFYSHFPSMFSSAGHEKYGTVPNRLQQEHSVSYLVSVDTDFSHQLLPRNARAAALLRLRAIEGVGLWSLDAHTRWRDMFLALRNVRDVLQMTAVARSPGFADFWRYRGADLSPYVSSELFVAGVKLAHYRLHYRRTLRALQRVRPSVFVTYLFEFPYGRAMIAAARSLGIKTVGVAHGPVSAAKLAYCLDPAEIEGREAGAPIPLPDRLIVEGQEAAACLTSSGIPQSRVTVGGAPRLRYLSGIPSRPTWKGGRRRVLVALGQHDAAQVLGLVAPIVTSLASQIQWVIRPHPRSGWTPQRLERHFANDVKKGNVLIDAGPAATALRDIQQVVASYSSVGIEAAMLGYPVLWVQLRGSPSSASAAALSAGRLVCSAAELGTALSEPMRSADQAAITSLISEIGERAEDEWVRTVREYAG